MDGNRPLRMYVDSSSDESDEDRSKLLRGRPNSYQSVIDAKVEHEKKLDNLGQTIKKQKYMAGELANEVDLHNEILDDVESGMARTNENLSKTTRNMRIVSRESGNCFLWFVIILLAIVIVVLAIL